MIFKKISYKYSSSYLILISFILISIFYFGFGSLFDFDQKLIGDGHSTDRYFYVWCLAWWPYAITHMINPFITYAAWAPFGFNLTKTTAIPGLALLGSPVTFLAGPIVTYNLLAILAPGLGAWTMFLLCNYCCKKINPNLTTRNIFIAAFLGSYLYGFSSYEMSQMLGHLNLAAGIFLLPLLVYLSIRYVHHEVNKRWFIGLTSICLVMLFLISSEIFVVFTLFAGLGYGLSYLFFRKWRQNLRSLFFLLIICYAITTLIVTPYLYYFMAYPENGNVLVTRYYYNDLLSLINPTPQYLLSNHLTTILGSKVSHNYLEQNCYLGIPLIILTAIFCIEFWKQPFTKILIGLSLITLVFSFGPDLYVASVLAFKWPWHQIFLLPIIKYLQVNRFGLFLNFYVALITAIWLIKSSCHYYLRYSLAILSIVFLLPSSPLKFYSGINTAHKAPEFFSKNNYKKYIQANENVMILPFGKFHPSALWQAKTNFYFRMPSNPITVIPPVGFDTPMDGKLHNNSAKRIKPEEFKQYVKDKKIDVLVVSKKVMPRWQALLSTLTIVPKKTEGVLIYRFTPS